MSSINKRRVAAAVSTFVLFVATFGLVYVIEVDDLQLFLYRQNEDHYIRQEIIANATTFNHSIELVVRDEERKQEKFARLSSLYSNIAVPPNGKKRDQKKKKRRRRSPACHPHFHHLTSNTAWSWSDATKFKRIYFYHARKAGGTSLANYFYRVADHYGLEFDQGEWIEAEEPGTHQVPTFYVTHLREPVARSISHFKYSGRWDCRHLIKMRSGRFTATEDNAMKLETWNATGGHTPFTCPHNRFKMAECAVNCYTQWFTGACPEHNTTMSQLYQAAIVTLLRYNFIVVLERMIDPDYVSAVEEMFGVPEFDLRHAAFCERASHKANTLVPLVIKNDTVEKLIELNEVDIGLYNELTDCLDRNDDGKRYNFPKFDGDRFDMHSEGRRIDKARKKQTSSY